MTDYTQRCEKLLELHPAVYVHAVGRKCIPVAVNVAQQLREDSRLAAAASPGGGDYESKVLRVESYSQAVDIRGGDPFTHRQTSRLNFFLEF